MFAPIRKNGKIRRFNLKSTQKRVPSAFRRKVDHFFCLEAKKYEACKASLHGTQVPLHAPKVRSISPALQMKHVSACAPPYEATPLRFVMKRSLCSHNKAVFSFNMKAFGFKRALADSKVNSEMRRKAHFVSPTRSGDFTFSLFHRPGTSVA